MIPPPMPPDRCARVILGGVAKNRSTIVVTGDAKALWWLTRLSPDAGIWLGVQIVDRLRRVTGRA